MGRLIAALPSQRQQIICATFSGKSGVRHHFEALSALILVPRNQMWFLLIVTSATPKWVFSASAHTPDHSTYPNLGQHLLISQCQVHSVSFVCKRRREPIHASLLRLLLAAAPGYFNSHLLPQIWSFRSSTCKLPSLYDDFACSLLSQSECDWFSSSHIPSSAEAEIVVADVGLLLVPHDPVLGCFVQAVLPPLT